MRQLRDSKISDEWRIEKKDISITMETAGIRLPACVEMMKKVKDRIKSVSQAVL